MWDLPGPGLEPVSPALAGGFLTTVPPGKPGPRLSKQNLSDLTPHPQPQSPPRSHIPASSWHLLPHAKTVLRLGTTPCSRGHHCGPWPIMAPQRTWRSQGQGDVPTGAHTQFLNPCSGNSCPRGPSQLPALPPEGRLHLQAVHPGSGGQRATAAEVWTGPGVLMFLSQQKDPCCVGWSRGWESRGRGAMPGLGARGRYSLK